ncbi:hypothetical protein O0881_08545 [Janthinobacterium sp. SUN100]|uniref:hypothetical protein n=1 Tax=Janthinobacterium sp. SUN100 TaxID=3004101 RepID=UPI0025B22CB1|nr:hypothetical protein [Janthinobacterium sp. SUN100]MDN2702040.1 hypothetical protein [Janthinobacterium sp. SUN100]
MDILAQFINAAGQVESLEEKRFYAEKSLPKFYKGTLAFEPILLKSNLFGHGSGARAVSDVFRSVAVYGNTKIEFKGEELRQDDLRVLLALLRRRAGVRVDGAIEFLPRAFCREDLGWADSGESVNKLEDAVLRLADARARVYYEKGMLAMSFISDARLAKVGGWSIWLSGLLAPIFERNLTFLKARERLGMKDGLGTWLYGFIKADSCLFEFNLEKMRLASGSTYVQKEFNRAVSKALAGFEADGIVASFAVAKGKLKVCKA